MSETVKVGDVTMVKLKHLGWCSVDAHGEPLPSRDELCDALATVERERDSLRAQLETAQRERAEWEANAQRENAALVQAQQRIAALEAEAQDVKRVEAWIQRGNDPVLPEHRIAGIVNGQFGAFSEYDTADHVADSLSALGHALPDDAAAASREEE